MEEREIKIVTKVFFAISIILGSIFLFFIWGIARVDAADFTTIGIREQSIDENVNEYANITNSTYPFTATAQAASGGSLSRRRYIMYLSANFDKANMYNINFNITGTIKYVGSSRAIINWPISYITLYWYDGSNESPLSCSVTGDQQTTESSGLTTKVYNATINCENIKPSKNMTQIRVKYAYPTTSGSRTPLLKYEQFKTTKPTYTMQQGVDVDSINSNNNANTEKIINNFNQNTQDIINNFNDAMTSSVEDILENGKVCQDIDKSNIKIDNHYLDSGGNEREVVGWGITDYINIKSADIKILEPYESTTGTAMCFYNVNKEKISCINTNQTGTITIPNNSTYFRATINKNTNKPTFKICQNGNQSIFDKIGELYGIDDWEQQNPDKSKEEELEGYEDDLADYLIDDSDISNLDYSVDTTTNQLIWQIFTNTIQQNQVVFTAIISILFLGVIKLLLAR